jgi:nitrite reductase/ring-hydroxylating ferredoxin subunit
MPIAWHELPNAPAVGQLLGQREDLADGSAQMLELPGVPGAEPFRLLLLRSGQQVVAYANRCAHFGVPLAAKQVQLIYTPHAHLTCNVHYARYRWRDGACEAGECHGESLIPIPLEVAADGSLRIADNGPDHDPR